MQNYSTSPLWARFRLHYSVAAGVRFVGIAVAALVLAACATRTPQQFSQNFSEVEARDLFEEAFAHIQGRYIEPVDIAPLAVSGMRSLLAQQEPSRLSLLDQPNAVSLMAGGSTLASFRRPAAHDSDGWAELTAQFMDSANQAEPALQAMPAEDLYQAVMDGVVQQLDPYSRYTGARFANTQRASREGFSGIGVSIKTENGQTTVVDVLPETPAAQQGLQIGDLVTHVNGEPLGGLEAIDVVEKLRGPIGTEAVLTLQRPAPPQTLTIRIRRAYVVPATVVGRMDEGLAIIRISSFNRNTAADLEREYRRLSAGPRRVRGIVLDLRGNPGGLLDQAVLAADLFLSDGLVISTFGRHPASNSIFIADARQIAANVPMAILIDGRSASAAELMAAALQDRGRAVAIGTTTHGKGTVQNLAQMPNGGELIITWSRMQAPSGYMLDGLGVLPSICTASRQPLDSPAKLSASVDAYALQAVGWKRYDRVDAALAASLRSSCPAALEPHDEDLALALYLLRHPAVFKQALRPAVESADARAAAMLGAS